jgi:putative transcriptional regulator
MTPTHHPFPETLISYVSGALPNATVAVVACHLSMCRVCAQDVRRMELLGGLMLSHLDAGHAAKSIGERAFARASHGVPSNKVEIDPKTGPEDELLPSLLRRNLPISGEISWQSVSPRLRQYRIALPRGAGQMRLLWLARGEMFPRRGTRADAELALVLQGRLSGKNGNFVRGDVIDWTEDCNNDVTAAGDVDCVCLTAGVGATAAPHLLFREMRNRAVPLAFRLGGVLRSSAALAAGLALLIGFGLGWLVPRAPEGGTVADLVRVEGNHLIAEGALRDALNVIPSGREMVAFVDGGEVRLDVKMTFEEQSGHYCRQYRIIASSSRHFSGIACRTGGDWTVRLQALLPPSASGSEQTIPADAGANAAIDAVIGAWISGNPLVGNDEAAVMSKGWQK